MNPEDDKAKQPKPERKARSGFKPITVEDLNLTEEEMLRFAEGCRYLYGSQEE